MALINCPECGKQISDKAISCIYCGYPLASELSKSDPTSSLALHLGFTAKTTQFHMISDIGDGTFFHILSGDTHTAIQS